jgi:predicted metal-dependent hydrolase
MPEDTALDQLRRWQESGGRWSVLARGTGTVTIALLTCDTGEEVDRMSSGSPALLAYLGERDSSEDDLPAAAGPVQRPMPVVRDRDTTGRPRNARPRDALGRPLPSGAPGIPTMPDDLDLTPADALLQAQRLLDDGLPFHAHEVLEAAWKAAPADERELWRGLAQLAVGLTHAHRGNTTGAQRLLLRSAERIGSYEHRAPHGIAAGRLSTWARTEAARLGGGDPAGDVPMPRLTT